LGSDGNLWIESNTMQARRQLAASVLKFQVLADNTVYMLFADMGLRRHQTSLPSAAELR
jgi:hypothetical protein